MYNKDWQPTETQRGALAWRTGVDHWRGPPGCIFTSRTSQWIWFGPDGDVSMILYMILQTVGGSGFQKPRNQRRASARSKAEMQDWLSLTRVFCSTTDRRASNGRFGRGIWTGSRNVYIFLRQTQVAGSPRVRRSGGPRLRDRVWSWTRPERMKKQTEVRIDRPAVRAVYKNPVLTSFSVLIRHLLFNFRNF